MIVAPVEGRPRRGPPKSVAKNVAASFGARRYFSLTRNE